MPQTSSRLVIAEDDEVVRNLLEHHTKKGGWNSTLAANGREALDAINEQTEVVLLDLHMPEMNGFQSLELITKEFPCVAPVVLSGAGEASDAVRAMKLGAVDYLTKPFDPDELLTVINKASHLAKTLRENETLKKTLSTITPDDQFVSGCRSMDHIVEQATKVAAIDATVLLTGESGVGKGMLARLIHSKSPRAHKPFVTVSCPALPRELLESELFGHEKGAFTGAIKKRLGKLEAADGGTVFLDEIGELPLDLQPKLLNALQDREFQRLGGETNIQTDVRLIAASNIDFEEKIRAGQFREDLYYRLSVLPIEIPPLRERIESIPELAQDCLRRICRERNCPPVNISPAAMKKLCSFHWPGNVRQLQNILERVSIFCSRNRIEVTDLPPEIDNTRKTDSVLHGLAGIPLKQLEREALLQTLDACRGNKAETARQLGITEKSVYNKLKRHGLIQPKPAK
ncbi:MAG: sigma-54 dependent transcriptional regulator [Verrucomicrobiota bacterium]